MRDEDQEKHLLGDPICSIQRDFSCLSGNRSRSFLHLRPAQEVYNVKEPEHSLLGITMQNQDTPTPLIGSVISTVHRSNRLSTSDKMQFPTHVVHFSGEPNRPPSGACLWYPYTQSFSLFKLQECLTPANVLQGPTQRGMFKFNGGFYDKDRADNDHCGQHVGERS